MEKLFSINLSVSAVESISNESSIWYKSYYDSRHTSTASENAGDLTVVSFDGKGIPFIKKEAAKIKGKEKVRKGRKRKRH